MASPRAPVAHHGARERRLCSKRGDGYQVTMTKIEASGPNAAQIDYWNDESGQKWVEMQEMLDLQLAPLGEATIDALGVAEGERVLDVGCGCGHTSLELARRVGPTGAVTGLDISHVMLEAARAQASEAGLDHATFVNADAQTHTMADDTTDAIFSRFGVMFFEDPYAAFANLRTTLQPDGRIGFTCWQGVDKNPWMSLPMMVAMQHITLEPPTDPHAPGPFAFADADRVRDILDGAGFDDISIADHRAELAVGGNMAPEDAVRFLLKLGPAGRALREQNLSEEQIEALERDVIEALAPYDGGNGVVMDSAVWIVTAKNG